MDVSSAIKPRLSEKAYNLSENHNTYVFEVPKSATKQEIANSISKLYGVQVQSVNFARTASKTRQTVKRGRRFVSGRKAVVCKAYVKLASKDKIPVFANLAADSQDDQSADKNKKKEDK